MSKKRKTKEEKIRVKIRRLQKQLAEGGAPKRTKTKVKEQKEDVAPLKPEPSIKEITYPKTQNYLFFDLRKTAILTLIAIGLELVVYWWLKTK